CLANPSSSRVENWAQAIALTAASNSSERFALGKRACCQAAITPMTANGAAPSAPARRYSAGSQAYAAATNSRQIPMLIHHGERSSTANSEFGAIFSFMTAFVAERGRQSLLCRGAWAKITHAARFALRVRIRVARAAGVGHRGVRPVRRRGRRDVALRIWRQPM